MTQGRLLLELADHDLAIMRLEKRLDELPEKRAILAARQKIKEIEALAAKAEKYVAQVMREVQRNSDEVTKLDEKASSEQQRMMSGAVTNPKELTAIQRELDSLRRQKEKIEIETLKLMEQADQGRSQADKIAAAMARMTAQEQEFVAAFKDKGGELQKETETERAARAKAAKSLEPALLERYEATRAAKHGLAVGKLDGETCTACRMELPTERVQALLSGPPVATCPTCHRLLVIGEPESEDG